MEAMFKIIFLIWTLVGGTLQADPATDQLPNFKNKTLIPIGTLTTTAGVPVESRDAGSTLNTNLNRNEQFVESINHLVREKTVERIVHAKGAAGFGYFISMANVSSYCKAAFLEYNTTTPVVTRFSVASGSPETSRTLVGFAIKFYTREGNFDMIGINSPTFVLKDPSLFVPFIHAFKRNPATNLKDVNMLWDYVSLHPESILTLLRLFGDRGIPDCYRHMPGYSVQTYVLHNAAGVRYYSRIYIIPNAGIQYMNSSMAATIGGSDPDYCSRDLYKSIGNGVFPSWNVSMQILTEDDMKSDPSSIFDACKMLSEDKYPLQLIGQLVLNRNPLNYFADVEQLAFNPGNLVPGIEGSPDKVFEARLMAYRQAQAYRLGINYNNILVNYPFQTKVLTYDRDGLPAVNFNGFDAPNYYPNSFNGPVPYVEKNRPPPLEIHENEPDNYQQASDFYTNNMPADERSRFVQTVVKSLCLTANYIQDQTVAAFAKVNSDLSSALSVALTQNNCKH